MSAKLLAYEHVPPGFEMAIVKKEVKAWNLWWNVKLTDDPEAWDDEVKLVNAMQGRLGELTLDQRLIRAHIAEFCRENPLFPRSIDILCEEIGHGRLSEPLTMGCEGRGLLESLGYHDPQRESDETQGSLERYSRALKRWMVKDLHPENPTESKVFGFLGPQTEDKEAFVDRLLPVIEAGQSSFSSLMKLLEDECRRTQGESILATRERPLSCFRCEGSSNPGCRCSYSMLLDAGLLCVRAFGDVKSLIAEFGRFYEENILAYSGAVNSWLRDAPAKPVAWLKDARYVSEEDASRIAVEAHSTLGERDEGKEWLAACLLKTVKDNQRWHKRTELIDDLPEVTSWFRSSTRSFSKMIRVRGDEEAGQDRATQLRQ